MLFIKLSGILGGFLEPFATVSPWEYTQAPILGQQSVFYFWYLLKRSESKFLTVSYSYEQSHTVSHSLKQFLTVLNSLEIFWNVSYCSVIFVHWMTYININAITFLNFFIYLTPYALVCIKESIGVCVYFLAKKWRKCTRIVLLAKGERRAVFGVSVNPHFVSVGGCFVSRHGTFVSANPIFVSRLVWFVSRNIWKNWKMLWICDIWPFSCVTA